MKVTASEIARFLGIECKGPDLEIEAPAPASAPTRGALIFLKSYSESWLTAVGARDDVCIIAGPEYDGRVRGALLESRAPRLDFARAVTRFFPPEREEGIAETARIHPTAKIGADVAIGEYTVIGAGVVIGERSIIRNHVVIHRNCQIGKNSLVKSSTVIGEEGFGFEFDANGAPVRIPHLGRVVIGDHVEIGAMDVIARGTLGDTVISDHAKLDDHVFIAHNVFVGENAVIIAGAEVSGSVRVGRDAWIAPQATIINQAVIGERAMVGIGAVVTKSVEPNVIVVGNPAKVLKSRS
jgi:UDP-3-O-[3-hydroxymyristoyl] glucosamine N-acyltransferase